MMEKSGGTAIFCDDIRDEVGGKKALMGVYRGVLFYKEKLPIVLPRLGIFVRYFEEVGFFRDDIQINVWFPGNEYDSPGHQVKIERNTISPNPSFKVEDEPFPDSTPRTQFDIPILISPYVIERNGIIRVRAICGDTVTGLGTLQIGSNDDTDDSSKKR